MTESDWLAHDDPLPMLDFLAGRISDRKARLFLCSGCHLMLEAAAPKPGTRPRRGWRECLAMLAGALDEVTRFADGLVSPTTLEAARRAAEQAEYVPAHIDYGGESGLWRESDAVLVTASARLTREDVLGVCRQTLSALTQRLDVPRGEGSAPLPGMERHGRDMAQRLRDIVGNPFRTVTVDPAWIAANDGNVARVAESLYANSSFNEMPFLADALEDAGCGEEEILGHLRGPGPHVRGCWALDLFIEAPRRFAAARQKGDRPPFLPGDWSCPGCTAHNYARRWRCHHCDTRRPT